MNATRHPMAHTDAAWLRMDRPANPMVVNGVLWFDEPLDWDAFEERVREAVLDRFVHATTVPKSGSPGIVSLPASASVFRRG